MIRFTARSTGVRSHDRVGLHDAILRGGKWVQPGVRGKSYKEIFGCVDALCY